MNIRIHAAGLNRFLILFIWRQDHQKSLQLVCGKNCEPGEPAGFTLPLDEEEVDGDRCQDHRQPDPGLHRLRQHREESDDQGHQEVDDREPEVDLDWPREIRLLPPEVRETEHGGSDRKPSCESEVVH